MSLEEACANPAFPLPVGSIFPYMGLKRFIPPTFLWCNGSEVKIKDYPELYKAIGNRFQGSLTPLSEGFYLPQLGQYEGVSPTDPVYLVPNPTIKTDDTTNFAILPPTIHSSDALPGIAAANIPALAASDFTATYPDLQDSITGRTLNARGENPQEATNTDGTATPKIVKLNASNETGATATLDDMTIEYSNPNPEKVGDIKLNATHEVNYGGMTCIYLIKAQSSYRLGGNADAINARQDRQQAIKTSQAAEKVAYRGYVNQQDAEEEQKAEDEKDAIADKGQGGGTTIEYEDVPQLSGFILDPNPQY